MPSGPWIKHNQTLTGRVRYRQGKERTSFLSSSPVIIAQVEVKYQGSRYPWVDEDAEWHRYWVDMTIFDLQSLDTPTKSETA